MSTVLCFALLHHSNARDYWAEIVIARRLPDGGIDSTHSYFRPDFARRLIDRLADKYRIAAADRAGMYCGSIMTVPS